MEGVETVSNNRFTNRILRWSGGLALACVCILGPLACNGPNHVASKRGDGSRPTRPTGPNRLSKRPARNVPWQEKKLPPVEATMPTIPGAKVVNDDDALCKVCHEDYVKFHQTNVHRMQSCETCHGPGSEHVRTRGLVPGLILSFSVLGPAERSELCIQCHLNDACMPVQKWRVSTHAQKGVSCTECHIAHYNLPPGTPKTSKTREEEVLKALQILQGLQFTSAQQRPRDNVDMAPIRAASHALAAATPESCLKCHKDYKDMLLPGHPHETTPGKFQCTTCHDAHGNVSKAMRTDQCLKCHQNIHQWPTSQHAQNDVACAECHNPHANRVAILGNDPKTCTRCHEQYAELERVAHPHQVCEACKMKCSTCHDPHGNIREQTRTDLCLKCHKGHTTMAWSSGIHALNGVACVDCHNPHPDTEVPAFEDIQHTHVRRPKRMPMSVEDPYVCYQCHHKIAALFELPSHHPVREGKMVCADCHEPHGTNQKNLKEPTVNLTCYRCHAELSGPFVWEHPPVSENCDICHNPHGTVANNLLLQPPVFLCLRCHAGHRSGRFVPIDSDHSFRAPFYTNCTQCHVQIHGSDHPAETRNGPRGTR
jgi:DmsE family decaheme c-type cytochrome